MKRTNLALLFVALCLSGPAPLRPLASRGHDLPGSGAGARQAAAEAAGLAQELLEASGVQGGLLVHLGCRDGSLTAALAAGPNLVVQGLDRDPARVQAARQRIRSLGLDGTVSAVPFDGRHLPYVDNLVNLLIAPSGTTGVPEEEIARVLAPGGVVLARGGRPLAASTVLRSVPCRLEGWSQRVKPWPETIDEWTHYLHDPKGTAVSADRIAGHPRGLQWTGGPFWARSHEHTASMQAMVSAAGRVFHVMDEGPTESIQLPAKLVLTARDAFNGVVLWKRPLHDWFNPLFPLKSGPGWMPRRLVAVRDKVYLAPGVAQDLLCLDAASGKVLRSYPETATTLELIVSGGVLFAAVDPDHKPCDYCQENANCWKERDRASVRWGWNRDDGTRVLKAIRAASGAVLWQHTAPVAPMTLAANDQIVCYFDGNALVALDRHTGQQRWEADVVDVARIPTGYGGPRLVLCGDRVLFSPIGHIVAVDTETGNVLWSVKNKPRSGHFSLEDLYVLGDRIWVLGRGNNGVFTTYRLEDGQQVDAHRNPIRSFYIHQRCYPGRATERFLLPPMMGTTVYDMEQDAWSINHWVRGGCIYGMMPANGMLYATPHACACYYQSKLNGFNALTPEPQSAEAPPPEKRLTKGPAYGAAGRPEAYPADAWPTFRHDNPRSGYARTDVAAEVRVAWKQELGTRLSQPVVAGGKLLVAAVDQHAVDALDAASGRRLWRFLTGGRVNSPPTLYRGLALFGSADGFVYAVRISDGELAWRFQAAPSQRQLVAYGQLESVWPLAGSVLIQHGKLYTVAGRSMFLDGGLRLIILRPETGELLAEHVMDSHVPKTGQNLQHLLMGKHMPVALPDILSSDGQYVYMKSQTFTLDGQRVRVRPQRPDTQYDEEVHLFAPVSFLDDAWHQRTYWLYGRAAGEGWAEFQLPAKRVPYGRILCLDASNAYAYGRDPELLCNTSVSEYRLYSADKIPARKVGIPRLEGTWVPGRYPADDPLAAHSVDWKKLAQLPREKLTALNYHWIHDEPEVIAKAMVLANDHLFVAGPRDVVDEKAMWGRSNEKLFQQKMAEQADWLAGRHGGLLDVYAKKDGKRLARHRLPDVPVFDGLVAAHGSLYLVSRGGSVFCLKSSSAADSE